MSLILTIRWNLIYRKDLCVPDWNVASNNYIWNRTRCYFGRTGSTLTGMWIKWSTRLKTHVVVCSSLHSNYRKRLLIYWNYKNTFTVFALCEYMVIKKNILYNFIIVFLLCKNVFHLLHAVGSLQQWFVFLWNMNVNLYHHYHLGAWRSLNSSNT